MRGKRPEGAIWPAALSILAISVLFGLVHAGNPNATLLGIINVTLAGVMLGVPFLATGRLAMPIGIHFAWNFVQGGVVGVPVSGLAATNSLLITHSIHEDILAGGAFGFEGGLLGNRWDTGYSDRVSSLDCASSQSLQGPANEEHRDGFRPLATLFRCRFVPRQHASEAAFRAGYAVGVAVPYEIICVRCCSPTRNRGRRVKECEPANFRDHHRVEQSVSDIRLRTNP